MLKSYNTSAKPLTLPEYGRNIQNMIDHCLTLQDRQERQRCAEAIIHTIKSLHPTGCDRKDYDEVLWEHLYIMSDFRLDIDFPYEISKVETSYRMKPDRLEMGNRSKPLFRHYGHAIEKMIELTLAEQDDEKRKEMTETIAIHMKRSYVIWNNDMVSDTQIYTDLYEMSKGQLYLDEFTAQLPDAKVFLSLPSKEPFMPHPSSKKRRKRRR